MRLQLRTNPVQAMLLPGAIEGLVLLPGAAQLLPLLLRQQLQSARMGLFPARPRLLRLRLRRRLCDGGLCNWRLY
jgi:hypothetical protein